MAAHRVAARYRRRSYRPARSFRRARRLRCSCCRSSCGLPCSACGSRYRILEDMARTAACAVLGDDRQDDVLGGHPKAEFTLHMHAKVLGLLCSRHCVASTWPTSLVPMPNASAPNAPCVAVWLSPHTMVMPGCVSPTPARPHGRCRDAPTACRAAECRIPCSCPRGTESAWPPSDPRSAASG